MTIGNRWVALILIAFFMSSGFAKESFKQETLPDGSKKMEFKGADGSQMTQIQKPDGTIEIHSVDAQGTVTASIQKPDGNTEVKPQNQ